MPHKKTQTKPASPLHARSFEQKQARVGVDQSPASAHPTVSGRWILIAASVSIATAAVCGWLTLCLLFWQGSWQLLYRPASPIARTPASAGLAFDPVAFAATDEGQSRLKGWWIPAEPSARYARYSVLYLHGQAGNLGDAVDELAALHSIGINIFAFDYRGYGQSQPTHPSEARWREDAEWALTYMTATRHIAAGSIVLDGRELGANLALEVAAAHPELAGVVIDAPVDSPLQAIFSDPRTRMIPARLLMRDRFDANLAAAALRIPSLWLDEKITSKAGSIQNVSPPGYEQVQSAKMLARLPRNADAWHEFASSYARWMDDLAAK